MAHTRSHHTMVPLRRKLTHTTPRIVTRKVSFQTASSSLPRRNPSHLNELLMSAPSETSVKPTSMHSVKCSVRPPTQSPQAVSFSRRMSPSIPPRTHMHCKLLSTNSNMIVYKATKNIYDCRRNLDSHMLKTLRIELE